jgi:DHA2 family multidrug resistance protein
MLKDPDKARSSRIDVVGVMLLAAGLGSMQYVLTEGEPHYWFADHAVLFMAVVMVVALGTFVYWEFFGTTTPIVDLRLLRNKSVAAGSVLALALGAAVFGSTYILPQFTQGPLGFTPTLSGDLFLLRALPIFVVTPILVQLTGKIDVRIFLGAGFVLIAWGCWLQAAVTTAEADFWSFAPALLITGAGAALLFTPLSIAVLGATTPAEGSKATSFINLSLQLGGSLAVALLDVVIDQRWTFHSILLGTTQTLASPEVRRFLSRDTVAQLSGIVNDQAAILSYADATLVIALISIVCVPLVLLMGKRKPAARDETSRSAPAKNAHASGTYGDQPAPASAMPRS